MNARTPLGIALAVGVALALAACSQPSEPTTPTAAAPTAPTASDRATTEPAPTASPTDPYAIPDRIDEAYVERVLDALGAGYGFAVKHVVDAGELDLQSRNILAAIHGPEANRDVVRTMRSALSAKGVAHFVQDPGALDYEVTNLLDAREDCVFAVVTLDATAVVRGGVEPLSNYVWLERGKSRSFSEANPTPWVIAGEASHPNDGRRYKSPCGT